jgi:signal transduction histidine kinase/DNA-binding response OmpR family regulator/HPt (histidine-containing phosphotransfer) domain-containing protein
MLVSPTKNEIAVKTAIEPPPDSGSARREAQLRQLQWLRFLLIFIGATLLLGGWLYRLYATEAAADSTMLRNQQASAAQLLHNQFLDRFDTALSDLRFLAAQYVDTAAPVAPEPVGKAGATPPPHTAAFGQAKERLTDEFIDFCQIKQDYNTVRFFDQDGSEVVRVDVTPGKPALVFHGMIGAESADQEFEHSFRLEEGDFWLSPPAPAYSGARQENPPQPVFYLGVPLIHADNEPRGALVLGLRLQQMLGHIQLDDQSQYMIADPDGRYLRGLSPRQSWSADGTAVTLARDKPELWRAVLAAPSGQYEDPAGLYSFIALSPHDELHAAPDSGAAGPPAGKMEAARRPSMYLLTFLPAARLHAKPDQLWHSFLLLFLILDLAAVGAAWLLASLWVKRQRAEEQLRHNAATLAASNRQLDMALLDAQAATRAKSEFLAVMSHEIRTPMNGVLGMLDLLHSTPLSAEQLQFAAVAKNSALALLQVINDILDFSKIEAGRLELEEINFDLRVLLEEVVRLFAMRAAEKGLELGCMIHFDVPTAVNGDPGRLRQILTNLLGNAFKFTSQGEILLEAEVETEQAEDLLLRFTVCDTGIGIPADKLDRLFKSFSQVDASTTRQFGGTGLGLAISKRLVETHGGEIGVDSEPGIGSTFWFTVRLKRGEEPVVHSLAAPERLAGLRVLVVDDNRTNLQIVKQMLLRWGCHTLLADSAAAGMEQLYAALEQEQPIELVVLDYLMPEMDGLQFARAIRAAPELGTPRLLLLTSVAQRGDAAEIRQHGIDAYLAKPVTHSQLYNTLLALLGEPTAGTPHIITQYTPLDNSAERVRLRLLLVEDNEVNQQVALNMLRRAGLSADLATNGLEALEAVQQQAYDLVLMDVHMPELDGLEATRRIRALGGVYAVLPIVAMTANAMEGDRQACLSAGMNDYLAKPFKPDDLLKTIRANLNRALLAEWDAAAASPAAPPSPPAGAEAAPPAPATPQPDGADDLPPLDIAASLERAGDNDFWHLLLEAFLDDVPKRLETLRMAIAASDLVLAVKEAHTLKGSSAELVAEPLRQLAFNAEQLGKAGRLDELRDFHPQLSAEFVRLRAYLDEQGIETPVK